MSITAAALMGATALSAGAGIAGGLIQANQSKKLMKKQYELNRKWEIERANNAHQWEVADLKKAGLNPILSAGGQGAMTGSVNVDQADTSGYANSAKSLSQNVNNLQDYIINQQNADANTTTAETNQNVGESQAAINYQKAANLAEEQPYIAGINKSQTAKNWAEASEKSSQIAVNKANVGLIQSASELNSAKTTLANQERNINIAEQDKRSYEANKAMFESMIKENDYKFYQKYGLTKDQAIELAKTGASIFPKMKKPAYTQINNYK